MWVYLYDWDWHFVRTPRAKVGLCGQHLCMRVHVCIHTFADGEIARRIEMRNGGSCIVYVKKKEDILAPF